MSVRWIPDFVLTWLPVLTYVVLFALLVALLVGWVTRRGRRAR